MVPVQSHTLVAVGYDPATAEMRIAFRRGRLYSYPNVPPEIHAGLMAAPSKGRYLYRVIRFRYRADRLS
jgi:hypothetical protein